ncbi:hypothetical protein BDQ17DRAFT_1009842 [Cyathus striatus]|nr:hypothetical protein BDQ17DRAFT_1009842 [Cyathus striatus]
MNTPVPQEVPPYQAQQLVNSVLQEFHLDTRAVEVRCAQALGSEIYVGCSNGELLRFALQADDPDKLDYSTFSRQTISAGKPVEEIVLIPSLFRALILSDRQLHFYVLPSLDPVPYNLIKPIRHVVTFAVDAQHLKRPPPPGGALGEAVDFCVIKRNAIAMYMLRDRLFYQKEIPLPSGASLARRAGHALCIADQDFYNMVDLEGTLLFQLLPLNQAPGSIPVPIKPHIVVIGPNEFLILSWTGTNTLGLFITGNGDPVRGTLEWPAHPDSISVDYPYVIALLPNGAIEVHSLETQTLVQVLTADDETDPGQRRVGITASFGGYFVPSHQQSHKMHKVRVGLLRTSPSTKEDQIHHTNENYRWSLEHPSAPDEDVEGLVGYDV